MADPRDIEGRTFQPTLLRGGLNLTDSKFDVFAGSLQDCLNYEASDQGYTRSQGLFMYDGTYSNAVEDMWYVSTTTGTGGESALYGGTDFILGEEVKWRGDTLAGTVVYWDTSGSNPTTTRLGIADIHTLPPQEPFYPTGGSLPDVGIESGDYILGSTSGTAIDLASTMATEPSLLSESSHANSVEAYLDFLNSSVNHDLVSQVSETGSPAHHGAVPGLGSITGGFQFQNEVYAVRDYHGIGFEDGVEELFPGDVVVTSSAFGDPIVGTVSETVLVSGTWANGDAAGSFNLSPLLPTEDWVNGASIAIHTTILHNGIIYVCKSAHTAAPTTEPGVGATWTSVYDVLDISLFDTVNSGTNIYKYQDSTNVIAVTRYSNTGHKGALWKGTILGWEAVDTGYSLEFEEGDVAPSVRDAPLFVDNMIAATKDEGALDWGTPVSLGIAPTVPWVNPGNGTTSDDTRATSTLTLATDVSALLDAAVDTTSVTSADVRIVGVVVEVEGQNSGVGTAVVSSVKLYNSNTDSEWYDSEDRAVNNVLNTGTDATYTFGGSGDMWGVSDISAQDILDGNLRVRLQCSETGVGGSVAEIDNVTVTVYYVPQAEHVYIYDGTSGAGTLISEGDITAWQITNGEYSWGGSPKPAGVFNMYNLDNPTGIKAGMNIYGRDAGAYVLLAVTGSTPAHNSLPSYYEMYEENARYESIVANFFADAGAEAVYGTTGASPAFSYNGTFFSYIRTPLLASADRPRHVAFHVNMLALGYKTGHVLLSTVGAPHDFSAATGGTSWGFKDAVTGLQELPGATLGVLTTSSTGTLTGTDPSSMSQKNVQPNSGAIEYTLQKNIEPYFLDFYGVSTLNTTQKFGDFNFGRMVDVISPWLEGRVQNASLSDTALRIPVGSISIRSKNQYRSYFADGWILTVTTFANRAPEATWQHYGPADLGYDYIPTFLDSTVLARGKERAIMGTNSGHVWVIDGANIMQTPTGADVLDAYITTNPINLGRPEAVAKYHHVIVQGQFYAWQQIEGWADTNYIFDTTAPAQVINIGSKNDPAVIESSNNLDSLYLSMIADGYSIKLKTEMDGSKPHTLQSLVFRASLKGTDRTRTTKAY